MPSTLRSHSGKKDKEKRKKLPLPLPLRWNRFARCGKLGSRHLKKNADIQYHGTLYCTIDSCSEKEKEKKGSVHVKCQCNMKVGEGYEQAKKAQLHGALQLLG